MSSGDPTRVEWLTECRDRLADRIALADERSLPSLSREMRAVLKELAELAEPAKGSIRDQLAEKRKAREAGASGSSAAEV